MSLEVKVVLLAKSELEKVVIERLLGDLDFQGCVFERVSDNLPVARYTVVESTPKADLLDDLLDRPFFHSSLSASSLNLIEIIIS